MSNAKQLDKSRAAFEKWCLDKGYSIDRSPFDKDRYLTEVTRTRWKAWQAACDIYAPKLTETEAVEIMAEAILDGNYLNRKYSEISESARKYWREKGKAKIEILAAAGMQFK